MKKIIVESHVPFAEGAFDGVAETIVLPPEEITPATVADVDALIVRTRTRCNADLLEGSKVGFVATATIGTDHFDLPYLASKGIEAVNAPGCNAPAVAQYVLASILTMRRDYKGLTLGVVGCGNVGSIVTRWAEAAGMNVLVCDPPRGERSRGWCSENPRLEGDRAFSSLEEVAEKADIVTFHTPHTRGGAHPTHHLADEAFFSRLKDGALIINSARGPVTDTAALVAALKSGRGLEAVIDCWEGEPEISTELLDLAKIATFHIAGYSLEGKKRATTMTVNAALRFLGSDRVFDLGVKPSENALVDVPSPERILASYNPLDDTRALREGYAAGGAKAFERMRNGYELRLEA